MGKFSLVEIGARSSIGRILCSSIRLCESPRLMPRPTDISVSVYDGQSMNLFMRVLIPGLIVAKRLGAPKA